MSTNADDLFEDNDRTDSGGNPDEKVSIPKKDLENLRGLASEGAKAAKRLEALERQQAFRDAGIDVSSKLGQMFVKSYDGELAADKIKEEAKSVGLIKDEEAPAETETPTDQTNEQSTAEDSERTQSAERSGLASGAKSDDGSGVDPKQAASNAARAAMEQGASYEDAAAGFVSMLADAALKGDKRVLVKESRGT